MVSYTACCIVYICNEVYMYFPQYVLYSVKDSSWLFFFLCHSLVGLLIDREKFVNINHLQQGEHTKIVMSLMVDIMMDMDYSKEEESLNCLVSSVGEFIIPINRVFGKSRNQLVLDCLREDKKKNAKGMWYRMGKVEIRNHQRMPVTERVGNLHQQLPVMVTIIRVRVIM